jgi:uncharacterized protein YkwD
MFKWFSKLNNIQRLSVVMALIAVIFTAILLAVMTFKSKLDSELNNPVVGLLNAQKDSQASAEEATGLELKMDKTEASVESGKTVQLTVKIEGDAGENKVSWDSSDEKIATVDESGLVTAKAVGTVTIRAKLNDKKTAISVIKVTEPPKPEPPKPAQPTVTTGSGSTSTGDALNQNAVLIENQILALVNAERAKVGKPALNSDTALQKGARTRSKEESTVPQDHNRADGRSWDTVIPEIGFAGWTSLGENIAYISGMTLITAEDANKIANDFMYSPYGWMNSEGHKKNILGTDYAYNLIGIGVNIIGNNFYAVQLFAQK